MDEEPRRLPPGTNVYDQYNGMRVGGLAGALAGAVIGALTTPVMLWAIPVLAVAGSAVGYRYEQRRIRRDLEAGGGGRTDDR